MNMPHCPQCQREFPGHDYCPVHGARLVAGPALAQSPVPATAPDMDDELEVLEEVERSPSSGGKLAALMKRLRLRPLDEKQSEPADTVSNNLPEELWEAGWRIAGAVASHAGIDRWPVVRQSADQAERALFSVYRMGSLTHNDCYQHLQDINSLVLSQVLAYGTLDLTGGARADYDLSVPPTFDGRPLDAWLTETKAGEERAQYLLPGLAALLQCQEHDGIQAIVLEPSHLVLMADARLALTVTGALALVEREGNVVPYRPEFARSSLLPQNWTAPEVAQQTLSANSALFSAGQLLAEAIFGQPFTLAEIQAGAIPFRAIADKRLSQVLMGCLYPKAAERWSLAKFLTAASCQLEELPPVAPWASLAPGAASTAFSFAGQAFWRLEDLLETAVLPPHWDETVTRIHDLLEWAKSMNWVGQAELLGRALAAGRTPDYALLRLARVVRPDAPTNWRALDLSDGRAQEGLGALAQKALQRDPAAMATMQAFFTADLRGALDG